ncbi:MAG TPA: FecR domain-containing protein [Candidatus Angelobacter sp.]|nr:FecR domain-containing protein [Candidatus Angelobacter sp.]
MKLSRITSFASLFLAVVLSAPAFAASDARSALPGTVNYIEGQVNIGSDTLNAGSIGTAMLEPNQTLDTGSGKAEVLLTPGVFLRVDDNSSVRMISPGLTNTEVELDQGRAMVEVAEIHDQNHLRIDAGGVQTQLEKKGLYEFDADRQEILVFDGKAKVFDNDKAISVGGGKRVELNTGAELKAHGFDKDEYEQSDLYQWSSLRSSYLAEANVNAASVYVADGYYGPGWIGAGWYWAPAFGGYTFIPADGILYSPFGWGFYSPVVVVRSPLFVRFGTRFHPGFVHFHPGFARTFPGRSVVTSGRPGIVGRNPAFHGNTVGSAPRPSPRFHSGAVRSAPPAFHGSNGGFHGGFSGGFHGGGHTMIHR